MDRMRWILSVLHDMKSVQIQSFFWSVFSRVWTEYIDLFRKSPYSVRIRENMNHKNPVFKQFSRIAGNTFSVTFFGHTQLYKVKFPGVSYTDLLSIMEEFKSKW